MDAQPVISLRQVTKRFPGVVANQDISLDVGQEIHAIVGENGAGKSTLMRVLCGLHRPDAGEIWLNGKRVEFRGPRQAISLGVGMVHQHFMLVNRFTVLENIILGSEPSKRGLIDTEAARRRVKDLSERFGFALDLDARIADLSVGQQQRVEILKVLYRGAQVLILDEPTAVLAPQEVHDLFANLRTLKDSGKTIIFISHKLDEVLDIADRISVLRRGRMVGTVNASESTRESIAQMMVGRPVLFEVNKPRAETGVPLLQLENATVLGSLGRQACTDVSLTVRAGEIYGVAGVEGNGQTELVEAIAGVRPLVSGRIRLADEDISTATPGKRRLAGLAHIPEDRHRRGLVLALTVIENFILGRHREKSYLKGPFIDFEAVKKRALQAVDEYDIRLGSLDAAASTLSGGNQQKIILSRELGNNPKVIIAAQPMRGLDIGASEFVRSILLQARAGGCAILLLSADLEDLMALSDQIGVMYRGRIVAELPRESATVETIGQYMLGSAREVAQ